MNEAAADAPPVILDQEVRVTGRGIQLTVDRFVLDLDDAEVTVEANHPGSGYVITAAGIDGKVVRTDPDINAALGEAVQIVVRLADRAKAIAQAEALDRSLGATFKP